VYVAAAAADEFSVSFAIIVVGASFSFVAVICLLILTSSSYRRCCRPTLTSGTRTAHPAVQSVSAGVPEPRLVGFTSANRGAGDHDGVSTTFGGGRQSMANHEDQRRRRADHAEPRTTEKMKSVYKHRRQDDDERPPAISNYLDTRSVSVPVIVDSRTDHKAADHRRRTAGITTTVVSARVDSGVSGMHSSVCTLSSSATQQQEQPPDLGVEASELSREQPTNCVDSSPVWNLSQMSMNVRSCPGGTSGVTLLPPLFLCQYINGYSDAMLMHVVDRQRRRPLHSSDIDHAASTTATHCSIDADDEEDSRGCGDNADTICVSRGALTVQTKAIVEPRLTASDHGAAESPCVCGQSHAVPLSLDPNLTPSPSDTCGQTQHLQPSTTNSRDLSPPFHFPSPPSSVCGQPLDLPPPPDCDRDRPSPPLDSAVSVIKTITPSSPSEVERRRLLTRLLLGFHDELALSPVYLDETYF